MPTESDKKMKAFPKDVTVKTMTIRHIGVENELGIKGCSRYDHDSIAPIEEECGKHGLLQSVGFDGGGREFRTNPISIRSLNQVRGFKYLSEYYGVLKNSTAVLESGGTHIHISILNSDHANMESNATAMAIAFYEQFQKIAGRKSSWASRGQGNTLKEVKERLDCRKQYGSRVYEMKGSMLNPTYHQTLEFRGGKGSNEATEIFAWIEFLSNLTKLCNRKSIEGVQFKQLLKGKRIEAYVQSLGGWRRVGKRDLEKKFNGKKLR